MRETFYQKISKRVQTLSILSKFTIVITVVFLICFLALTSLAKPVATNLAIEYAHRSMTQRLKVMKIDGFSNEGIDESYLRSLVQNGEFLIVRNITTKTEVFRLNEMTDYIVDEDLVNLADQQVIRIETQTPEIDGNTYEIMLYADINKAIEPYLDAYYRYVIPLITTNGILLTLAGVFTVMYLTRRIQTFTEKMRLIRANGYQEELPAVYTKDEVGEMIQVFNEMIGHFHELHEAQKQFVSDASHELKTPLAIIEGNAQLIEKWGKRDPEILDESIPALRRGVDRAKMLIDDLLALTRTSVVADGPIPALSMEESVLQYVRDLQVIHPEVIFELHLEPVSYPILPVDFNKLMNIFIENGIKYSNDAAKITIHLTEQAESVEIRVSDCGVGISQEHQQRIFERFYRVDSSRSRDTGGNGIGLAVAKKIVMKYNGDISVESELDIGSTFIAIFKKSN
ncbi:MAG: sensor histidine kinase [Culicoidibacterales bacterium]